jgi:hypothetical protein
MGVANVRIGSPIAPRSAQWIQHGDESKAFARHTFEDCPADRPRGDPALRGCCHQRSDAAVADQMHAACSSFNSWRSEVEMCATLGRAVLSRAPSHAGPTLDRRGSMSHHDGSSAVPSERNSKRPRLSLLHKRQCLVPLHRPWCLAAHRRSSSPRLHRVLPLPARL